MCDRCGDVRCSDPDSKWCSDILLMRYKAEADALRQDALRYRWLRDNTPDEITDEKWIDEFMSRAALCSHDGKA